MTPAQYAELNRLILLLVRHPDGSADRVSFHRDAVVTAAKAWRHTGGLDKNYTAVLVRAVEALEATERE